MDQEFRPLEEAERGRLAADPVEVAPSLLGLVLARREPTGLCAGRIVEVEAYRAADDPASHAHRGPTTRNHVMFGPPGFLYVYFTYGMHHCCNIVCHPEGTAGAVLIRALEPLAGLELMEERRLQKRRPNSPVAKLDLCRGPGRLCEALGIDRKLDGVDLLGSGAPVVLGRLGPDQELSVASGPRIGLSSGLATADNPWRWWVAGSPFVSPPRSGPTGSGDFRPARRF